VMTVFTGADPSRRNANSARAVTAICLPSARTEYIGQPQLVKQLFVSTATDLGRSPDGLVLQAVGKPYDFRLGTFNDADANAVICANLSAFSGAHSDIRHPEIVWAVVSAAGLGG
jgi:hypothetical protein